MGATEQASTALLGARYYDGRSARAQPVQLQLAQGQLVIRGDGVLRQVPVAEVTWPERTRHGRRVADLPGGGSVQCDDARAWDDWRADGGHREGWVVRAQQSWRWVLASVLVMAAVVGGFQRWGVPLAARTVASLAPWSVDQSLGESSLAVLDRAALRPSKLPMATQERVRGAFADALRAGGQTVPEWKLLFRDGEGGIGPNALALPGGTLIITDQLVTLLAGDTDVTTAVLAHEMGHVRHRHGLRMLVQVSLLGAVSSLVVGDFSSVLALAPVMMGQASYSRDAEREADAESVRILRAAGISPAVMLKFFERIAEARDKERKRVPDAEGQRGSWIGLAVASHPADAERIAFFRNAALVP